MNSAHDFTREQTPRPATADVRRALIMNQRLRATAEGPAPSRLRAAARTAAAVLVLSAVVAIVAVVGIALILFTLGIAFAATAALLVLTLVDRIRGKPARRLVVPAVIIRRS